MKEQTKIHKKNSLDLFDDLLNQLASWKKVSRKDYQTLERIYYKLLGKKQRLPFPKPDVVELIDDEDIGKVKIPDTQTNTFNTVIQLTRIADALENKTVSLSGKLSDQYKLEELRKSKI